MIFLGLFNVYIIVQQQMDLEYLDGFFFLHVEDGYFSSWIQGNIFQGTLHATNTFPVPVFHKQEV